MTAASVARSRVTLRVQCATLTDAVLLSAQAHRGDLCTDYTFVDCCSECCYFPNFEVDISQCC